MCIVFIIIYFGYFNCFIYIIKAFIIITKYAILPDDYEEGDTLEYTTISDNVIENEMIFDNTVDNFKFNSFTIRVYFEWVDNSLDEQMDDQEDTEIGLGAANNLNTFSIQANISFEQIV